MIHHCPPPMARGHLPQRFLGLKPSTRIANLGLVSLQYLHCRSRWIKMRFLPLSSKIRANFEMPSFGSCISLFSGPKGLEKLARNSSISKMSIMPIEIICGPPPSLAHKNATRAHVDFCKTFLDRGPNFLSHLWGISAENL